MPDQKFASRFKTALQLSGLKQKELAEILGVHPSNITRYKEGKYVPDNLQDIAKIAKALGVNPAWLAGMTDEDKIVELSPEDVLRNKIETYLDDFDEQKLSKILTFIEQIL